MAQQRGTSLPPVSAPARAGSGATAPSSPPPRSANSVLDVRASGHRGLGQPPDLSSWGGARRGDGDGDGDAASALYYREGGRPRRRPHPHPAAVVPGADPRSLLLRNRRGVGGFEDPSHVAPRSSGSGGGASDGASKSAGASGDDVPIPLAVLLWYVLGVVSIASSKVLLSTHNVPPLVLTVQQLLIGMTLLRVLLEAQTSVGKGKGEVRSGGLRPVPMQGGDSHDATTEKCIEAGTARKRKSSNDGAAASHVVSAILALLNPSNRTDNYMHKQLFLAGAYFALGFLLTNCGFRSSEAAFVETVKAAEPFTSAAVAVAWGIERLGREEVTSLTGIVAGVVLSTLGHRSGKPTTAIRASGDELLAVPSRSLPYKCLVVMGANLCFSFRGLHQKLFRATPSGRPAAVDDLNLQYRMQQVGALMLLVPTLVANSSAALRRLQTPSTIGGAAAKRAARYVLLSSVNGLAFASYNLASTHVLTRISVVHHAALNCVRRVFAIVATSALFGLRMTALQVLGIALAVGGFFSYLHYKLQKESKEKRKKELREKWGGIMADARRGGWVGKRGPSLLPVSNAVD